MSITVYVNVNTAATIKAGKPRTSPAGITLSDAELSSWTQTERDLLAVRVSEIGSNALGVASGNLVVREGRHQCHDGTVYYSGIEEVADPTPVGLLAAIRANEDKIEAARLKLVQEETDKDLAAIKAALDRKVKTKTVQAHAFREANGEIGWTPYGRTGSAKGEALYQVPDFEVRDCVKKIPEIADWLGELEDREQFAREDAKKTAVKILESREAEAAERKAAEAKKAEALKQWAMENGSEQTKRLISGGFDGWHAAAQADQAAIADSEFAAVMGSIVAATGWFEDDSNHDDYEVNVEPKRSPSIEDLDAYEACLPLCGPSVTCGLHHVEYTPEEDEDGDSESVGRTEINVSVKTSHGVRDGWLTEKLRTRPDGVNRG